MRCIFIGGCGRSGTSLVQKILAAHSKIIGGPEFDHTKDIFQLYGRMTASGSLQRQAFFYDKEYLDQAFNNFYATLLKPVFRKKPEARYVSEKTPANICVADTLLEVFPDSFFVNVVRDGRDVLVSHRDVKHRHRNGAFRGIEWTTLGIANVWNFSISKYRTIVGRHEFDNRVYTVRFEELVRNPEKALTGLFALLELKMEEKLLRPEELASESSLKLLDDIWYTREMYNQKLDPQKIGRWKKELPPVQKKMANLLMANNLSYLGYEVGAAYRKAEKIIAHPAMKKIINGCCRLSNQRLRRHFYS